MLVISHIFYKLFAAKKWYIEIIDDEISSFSILGERRIVKMSQLNYAYPIDLLFLKIYIFTFGNNNKKNIAITDIIQNYEECIKQIESHNINE